mgnify:CR=1 FL=1
MIFNHCVYFAELLKHIHIIFIISEEFTRVMIFPIDGHFFQGWWENKFLKGSFVSCTYNNFFKENHHLSSCFYLLANYSKAVERSARRLKCNAVVLELPNRPFLRRRARFSVYLHVVVKRILTYNFFVANQPLNSV